MANPQRVNGIERVGVIGSGIMGSGLAEVIARAGYQVIVRSRTADGAAAVTEGLVANLDKQVARERLEANERDAILDRVSATHRLAELSDCDLVIESIVEDMTAKKELFVELDEIVKPSALLTTNTSTLPVVELAMHTARPHAVCGLHFFNPAPVMKLVEVVRPITAAHETIHLALEFAHSCGKDAVEVADRAGFVVNALLFPYLNNAVRMLESGTASKEAIDTAMQGGCNFPMGPFALLDLVGIDTSLAILDALYDEFRDHQYAAVPTLRRMVAAGHLGRKTGIGFYSYS